MKPAYALLLLCAAGAAFAGTPPGHPTTGQAAQALDVPAAAPQQNLPYEGKVATVLQSNDYTFIEVVSENGSRWLAAPRIALKKGMTIRYGRGAPQANFYSKKLKRTFPVIVFVDRVAPVKTTKK